MDSEYTIRVTGGPPPPLPTTKGGKKGSKQRGGGGKNAALAQQQKRYNMRLRPSTPLEQFRRDVFALFNIPSNSTHLYNISFLGGFPPKELDQTDKSTVEQLGIRANESVIVKITLNDSAARAGNGSSTTNTTTTSDSKQSSSLSPSSPAAAATTSNNGRPKRAAAAAATASFPELIAAQNEMMKTEQKKKSNNRIATTYSSLPNGGGGGGGGKKSNKKTKIEGTGYRLSDGKAVEGSAATSKRKRSTKQQQPLFKSEDDIAGKLLSSMGSGGGGGNTGKFLRMAMKGAVEKSYEESRAAVRVAAVNKGAFSFEKVKGGTVVEGNGVVLGTAKDHDKNEDEGDDHDENEILGRTLYIVSYDKGLEGRGRYEEQVEIISEDALKGLIEHVYNTPSEGDDDEEDADENSAGKEMLRPVSMAQLSPRVFWSLVYHYNKANQNEPSANASVETMLQSTMPVLDWKFLDRGGRKRNRSEKARENWRQKKEAALLPTKSETDEDGVKAIEEMEESILEAAIPTKNDDGDNELSERERRARAAMARFGNGGDTETAATSPTVHEDDEASDDWMLVTPSEDDIDELIECIIEGREESETYDDKDAKVWAAALVDNVRNWRGLANADGEVVLSQVNNNDNLQLETIERWIEAAQQRSMEEIMLEILDGDQDALDALQDKAHSSTPKDLSFWYTSPGLLLDTLSKGEDDESSPWSETDVKRWASRAKTALNMLSWLNLYVTPV